MNKQTKAYAVYALYWPGRPEVYIGCSKNARNRLYGHAGTIYEQRRASYPLYQHWREHGHPEMLLIDECDTQEDGWAAEEKWIRLMDEQGEVLLNRNFGGVGKEYMPEWYRSRRKMHADPDWRRRNAYALRNKSPEWRRNQVDGALKVIKTPEWRQRNQMGSAIRFAKAHTRLNPQFYHWLTSDGHVSSPIA